MIAAPVMRNGFPFPIPDGRWAGTVRTGFSSARVSVAGHGL